MEQELNKILNDILESSRIGDHMSCEKGALKAILLLENESQLKRAIRHFKTLDNTQRFSPNQVVYILKQFNLKNFFVKVNQRKTINHNLKSIHE